MTAYRLILMLMLIISCEPAFSQERCGDQRVAFSFDDAPTGDTAVMTGQQRTRRIVKALSDGGVDEAIFYAVSSRINQETGSRMIEYAEAGHAIGSHSHTHANLHVVGAPAFLEDVHTSDAILSKIQGFRPYFRFPYLNEGKTVEERDVVRKGLAGHGYKQGYVTIDNFDFYIDTLLRNSVSESRNVDMDRLSDLYVKTIMDAARHYDAAACKWLKRSPAHVLLLHESDVAALFLPALISEFKSSGWKIVTASEAYGDPISDGVPSTLFLGQGRIAALAALAGAKETDLRHEGESTDFLRSEFQRVISAQEDRKLPR